mmetsp:Transcript_55575/g.95746  ORF Transcript_55575/g.95746 Transcript_55575/m.95746 type:complete len:99 (-) Transcript_55575:135-431(-)
MRFPQQDMPPVPSSDPPLTPATLATKLAVLDEENKSTGENGESATEEESCFCFFRLCLCFLVLIPPVWIAYVSFAFAALVLGFSFALYLHDNPGVLNF